jgi:hypothetical protein
VPESPDLEPELLAEFVARIDAAAAGAVDANDVAMRLALTEDEKKGSLGAIAMAFQYMPNDRRDDTQSDYFGSMFTMTDGYRYPPALADILAETVALWAAVGERASSPIARARLNDLCFEGRWGNRGILARRAIEAYLSMAGQASELSADISDARQSLVLATTLRRALALARKIRDEALASRTACAMVTAVRESLVPAHTSPHVTFGLLEALVADRTTVPELDDLLSQARTLYQDDIWSTAHFIELQLRRVGSNAEERTRLQREVVEGWIAEAENSQGIVRMKHLESAAKMARDYGLSDLADTVTTKLQSIQTEELNLVPRGFQFEIPADAMEQHFSLFTEAPSWQDAFIRLVTGDPPSGNTASNREQVEQLRDQAPLHHLLPRTRLGGDGLPRFTPVSEEQRDEWRLAEVEMLLISMQAGVVAEIMRRIWAKWGPISEADLTEFLDQGRHVPVQLAASIARAFVRHFNGDAEASAYTAMPKVEALVRALVLTCGLPIYRIQREKTPGQYPGLGALLPEVRKLGMDESWYRFMHTFLASVAGANERNELLHGFIDEVNEPISALVLLANLYLAVGVQPAETTASTST